MILINVIDILSEKQLCDSLLAWITANKQRCTEDICVNLLKQVHNNSLTFIKVLETSSTYISRMMFWSCCY